MFWQSGFRRSSRERSGLPIGLHSFSCKSVGHIRYSNLHQVDLRLIHFCCTTDTVEGGGGGGGSSSSGGGGGGSSSSSSSSGGGSSTALQTRTVCFRV